MAPRRGGGGGGYYSSSTSDICPGGFQDWYSQTIIAFDALYCVVFLVFFIVVGRRAKKTKTGGLAKCLTYISLTFAFAHILLQIVFNTLAQCGRIDIIENNAGMTASMWMFILMYYCLYTLILAPICHRLHNGSALVKIVTTIFLALLGVVLIAYLCLYTRITHAANIRESDTWEKYFLHSIRLITAYRVIEMVAMLIAAGLILSAMFRAAHLRAQPIVISLVALVLSAIGVGIVGLAIDIIYTYNRTELVNKSDFQSYLAGTFFQYFFYSTALLSAVYVWSSDQLDGARFSVPPPPHPPQYPGDMRQV